jgi:beta-N-acetylhexosaminidase
MTPNPTRSAEALAGRVVIAGFDGATLPADVRKAIAEDALGGVILFKRNIEDLDQVAALTAEIRCAAPDCDGPLIGVDQEGGRVVRLREPLTVLPPARRFGDIDDPALTGRAGELIGLELRAIGFTVDFAPVLDVDTHPASPIIGDRAFGGTPGTVTRHGLAFARGLTLGGVHPCAKHFPGHGDAALDSHLALPEVALDADRLRELEMAPIAAWCETGAGPVMTAHVVYPALDPDLPATLSRRIITGELRERLGFRGVVFTDDLEMGAIQALGGAGEVAVRAMAAGADGLLVWSRSSRRWPKRCRDVRHSRNDSRRPRTGCGR